MRALIFELRPGNIEEDGLIQALRTHAASLSGRIGLPVVVEAELAERPPIEVEETLYRIAQEALHNVVKHAGARQVRLEIGRVPDGVRLQVTDDGRGFDPTQGARRPSRPGRHALARGAARRPAHRHLDARRRHDDRGRGTRGRARPRPPAPAQEDLD